MSGRVTRQQLTEWQQGRGGSRLAGEGEVLQEMVMQGGLNKGAGWEGAGNVYNRKARQGLQGTRKGHGGRVTR